MNKNILYTAVALIVGLLGGWLIFGGSADDSMSNNDVSSMSNGHDHSAEGEDQMWTCSMHPQIMQPEPGDCPICGMDLVLAEAGADGLSPDQIKMTANALALADIRTMTIGNGAMVEDGVIALSGQIMENENANTVQASYFDGRIERLNVNYEGQKVSKGQLLATIYSPNLIAAQQELLTASTLKDSQPALYKAVRNKLRNWKLSEQQIAQIEKSATVQENFPIYATVSGTVTAVMAAQGDYVKAGQPIAKLSNLSTVWADFDAYENQINLLKIGQEVEITSNAYPNDPLDATITFIDPLLDTKTRVVTVRATLKNNDGLLKPGMFVVGKIDAMNKAVESDLTVPSTAVMWTGERSVVYVKVNPDEPIFEMREVKLGNRVGDYFRVAEGLNDGEEIVINGTFTIDAAAQLQGKKSMMNKSGGRTMTGHEGHLGMQGGSDAMTTSSAMKMELSKNVQSAFKESVDSYLKMKDAFVDGDAKNVSVFAKATSKSLKAIDAGSMEKMAKSHLNKSMEMLDAIAENDKLENQRAHFVILNENMVAIAMNIEGMDSALYVQKCPMANNNKGAVWLSIEEEIRNPYYGDAMLTCGSVIDSIQ